MSLPARGASLPAKSAFDDRAPFWFGHKREADRIDQRFEVDWPMRIC